MSKVEAVKSSRTEKTPETDYSTANYNPKDYLKKMFENGGTVFTVPHSGGGYIASDKSNSVFS